MIVLDTHALVWWIAEDSQLSRRAREVIEAEMQGGEILVSAISAWEVAMLAKAGRLALNMDAMAWLDTVAQVPTVRFVPVDVRISVHSVDLPGEFHKDPADRIIVATARQYSAPLVSADLKIRDYSHVHTVW
ncbi:Ribonuclease VapC22 [Achromobacter spanius]|uniref:type II toxin-antitoxin system VapC family toxin n=1 Tax=Achromobacter spanius TaxID=217203 RepID=UPI000C2C8A6D|nr:type II toxin-antitoxin system VapC family toxin [Achromobacter spanius]AUA56636.1 VapC toxin family PIN domain ribonuclease [Achromobacter spanius]CAB3644447.1 Ribonuclease VapC22 [Achromobacter spanius]SPT37852.1 Ribonuclease VapC22 [Achromobacter denitrificans]VEE55767.1 Ribonuclease VapC22 [Achromobacter spanius]